MKRHFNWQQILFADGSNPYICKTEKEFRRMDDKYALEKIGDNSWEATGRYVKIIESREKIKIPFSAKMADHHMIHQPANIEDRVVWMGLPSEHKNALISATISYNTKRNTWSIDEIAAYRDAQLDEDTFFDISIIMHSIRTQWPHGCTDAMIEDIKTLGARESLACRGKYCIAAKADEEKLYGVELQSLPCTGDCQGAIILFED